MSLQMALFLSSKQQARGQVNYARTSYGAYALLASFESIPEASSLMQYVLRVYRIEYPQKQELSGKGQGWGDSVIASEPHNKIEKNNIRTFVDEVEDYGFNTDEGWEPVEDEKEKVSEQ